MNTLGDVIISQFTKKYFEEYFSRIDEITSATILSEILEHFNYKPVQSNFLFDLAQHDMKQELSVNYSFGALNNDLPDSVTASEGSRVWLI